MRYKVIESNAVFPELEYTECFDSFEDAKARLKAMYHNVVDSTDENSIYEASFHNTYAYVILKESDDIYEWTDNEIEWSIEIEEV